MSWPTSEWYELKEKLDSDPTLQNYTQLITLTEQSLPSQPTKEQKATIYQIFNDLLAKWPLLFGYWKKLTSLTYQLDGLDASIATLRRAVGVFPSCKELWVDYFTILSSNYQSGVLLDGKQIDTALVRSEFERGCSEVGAVFMGAEVWDKWIAFEKETGNQEGVVLVLWKAVHFPLYDYARLYTEFTEQWNNLPVEKVSKITGLKGTAEELKAQFDAVFQATQTYVAEIWPFESVLKQKYFNNEINNEDIPTWEKYIEFQLQKYESFKTELIKTQIVSTFEQCLIPMASVKEFWCKYLNFHFTQHQQDIAAIDSIYSKICNIFLPVTEFNIRLSWALFQEAHFSDDLNRVEETYLSTIKYNSLEFKPLMDYIQFLCRRDGIDTTTESLDVIISTYFNQKCTQSPRINEQRLISLLNDKLAGLILAQFLKLKKEHNLTKPLILPYVQKSQLSNSIPFWTQCFKSLKEKGDLIEVRWIVGLVCGSSIPISYKELIVAEFIEWLEWNHIEQLTPELLLSMDRLIPLLAGQKEDKKLKRGIVTPGFSNVERPEITNVDLDKPADWRGHSPLHTFKNVEKAAAKILPLENE